MGGAETGGGPRASGRLFNQGDFFGRHDAVDIQQAVEKLFPLARQCCNPAQNALV
jgi:hypothetical protein